MRTYLFQTYSYTSIKLSNSWSLSAFYWFGNQPIKMLVGALPYYAGETFWLSMKQTFAIGDNFLMMFRWFMMLNPAAMGARWGKAKLLLIQTDTNVNGGVAKAIWRVLKEKIAFDSLLFIREEIFYSATAMLYNIAWDILLLIFRKSSI